MLANGYREVGNLAGTHWPRFLARPTCRSVTERHARSSGSGFAAGTQALPVVLR